MRNLLICLTLISVVSCAPKNTSPTNNVKNSSIINGSNVKENDAINKSIVAVLNTKSQYLCTGSLIAPNIILTAAHCAPDRISNVKIIFGTDIDNIMGSLEPDVKDEHILQAVDFKVSSSWNPKDETREIDTGDIMLIKFKGNVPEGYAPATFLADDSSLKIGTVVTVAGYGVDDVDTSKEVNIKKFPNLEDAIQSGEVTCQDEANGKHAHCFKVQMSGDGILRTTKAPINFIHETEINLNETKSGTCSGDSGGPAYIEKNGDFFLFGVTSRGSGLCNEVGVYTNALFYKDWIAATIKAFN
ncbi:MAG: trypsin-like serine protease [Rhizobacter sp.]|nr:trypsin-like serine protease [Bacteriovorax sp.]